MIFSSISSVHFDTNDQQAKLNYHIWLLTFQNHIEHFRKQQARKE